MTKKGYILWGILVVVIVLVLFFCAVRHVNGEAISIAQSMGERGLK